MGPDPNFISRLSICALCFSNPSQLNRCQARFTVSVDLFASAGLIADSRKCGAVSGVITSAVTGPDDTTIGADVILSKLISVSRRPTILIKSPVNPVERGRRRRGTSKKARN